MPRSKSLLEGIRQDIFLNQWFGHQVWFWKSCEYDENDPRDLKDYEVIVAEAPKVVFLPTDFRPELPVYMVFLIIVLAVELLGSSDVQTYLTCLNVEF